MSSTIVVYVIKESKLRQAIGSGEERLIKKINRNYQAAFEDFREHGLDALDDYSYEEAVRDLILGCPRKEIPWHLTGYAIEAILATLGELLGDFRTSGSSFDEHYNGIFERLGVQLDMTTLVCVAEIPDLFPEPVEEPYWGCWKLETCQQALKSLRNADISNLADDEQEIINNIHDWLKTAVRRKSLLVGMCV